MQIGMFEMCTLLLVCVRVLLKVSPTNGVIRFGKNRNLNAQFIGPFEILDKCEEVAYRLASTLSLSVVHLVFYISMLK